MISREKFRAMMGERTLLLDGAYGTNFFEMGLGGVPAELLNLEHADKVEELQRAYAEAGADMLLANTFGGNRFKLEETGLLGRMREIHFAAIEIAQRAAGGRAVLVLGDMSSTGRLPRPSGDGTFDSCREAFAEQAALLLEAGADGLIVETMTDIKEMKAALVGIREVAPDAPLIAQMAFDAGGTTLTGASIEVFAALASDLGADVIGMNCLVQPSDMSRNLRRLAACWAGPISVEPNAGNPVFDGVRTVYDTTPAEFASYGEEYIELGASIIGGCCGTTPAHIRALAAAVDGVVPAARRHRAPDVPVRVTSRTRHFDIGRGRFFSIGERINPTGHEKLRESMRRRDWDVMLGEAAAQAREGADALDVNFGVEKFFDAESIADAIAALDRAVSLPLSIDIQTPELMERAMAEYPGRPLINSSACDEESLAIKLPLLKKYGGVMVLLAMDGDISESAEERAAAVDRALAKAADMGIGPERFIIDPLVLSVGAGNDHRVTLGALRLLAERGLTTMVGLGNVSHGLPNRAGVNAAFLAAAIDAGVTCGIVNTGDRVVMETMRGAMLLKTGRIEAAEEEAEEADPLTSALLSGRRAEINAMVDERLASGEDPMTVSQSFLGGAMERIGELYERKKIFLPHILFAAETVFPVFDKLNAMMGGGGAASRGSVMIATVEGDIHDIGKNIVATVLRAGGFSVTDIGKNVPPAEVVAKARELKPDIVALSAMMTTTVGAVQQTAAALEEAGIRAAVISGGASMSEELAGMFGVRYSDNSSGALALCKSLVGGEAGHTPA